MWKICLLSRPGLAAGTYVIQRTERNLAAGLRLLGRSMRLWAVVMSLFLARKANSSVQALRRGFSVRGGGLKMAVSHSQMRGFRQRIRECNQLGGDHAKTRPLVIDGNEAGCLTDSVSALLLEFPSCFVEDPATGGVALRDEEAGVDERTRQVAEVMASLRERGLVTGWRDELIDVAPSFGSAPSLRVERAAYPLLGTKGYGIHVNGYVVRSDGEIALWVATRAKDKQTWPGKSDHIVAGQISGGLSPTAAVLKEAEEEAGIPPRWRAVRYPWEQCLTEVWTSRDA